MTQPLELKYGQWMLVKMRVQDDAPNEGDDVRCRLSNDDRFLYAPRADIHSVLPDVIEVGDRVRVTPDGTVYVVEAVAEKEAWLRYPNGEHATINLSDLTLVSQGGA